jgi:cytoskeletal protein CcmA (bactofilin family)
MARSTVIGPETKVLGGLFGNDDLVIEGTVDGPVTGEQAVTLAAGSKVHGEVRGRDVVIGGTLEHNLYASRSVRLLATAQMSGDIEAPRISIDDGALFEGRVRMKKAAPAAAPAPPRQPEPEPDRTIPPLATFGKKKLVRKA